MLPDPFDAERPFQGITELLRFDAEYLDVEIRGHAAEQQIAHASTDKEGFAAGLFNDGRDPLELRVLQMDGVQVHDWICRKLWRREC